LDSRRRKESFEEGFKAERKRVERESNGGGFEAEEEEGMEEEDSTEISDVSDQII
jgi:hypothetical protein